MAGGAVNPEADHRWVSGTVVTFEATMRIVGYKDQPVALPEPDADKTNAVETTAALERKLVHELWADKGLRERLQGEAQKAFDEHFDAKVIEVRRGGSVHLIAVLYVRVRHSVQVSAFRQKTEDFADTLRQALHDVAEHGLYDLVIDVRPRGAVLLDQPASSAAKEPQSAWDRISAVAVAVGTGIGVLGFVTFVGGAIEFARLDAAGLPAEEAVAVIPTANLVTIGATVLVPALVLALGAAALVYAWELGAALWYRAGQRGSARVGTRPLVTRDGLSHEVTNAVGFAPTPGKRAIALVVLFVSLETIAYFIVLFDGDLGSGEFLVFGVLAALTSGAVFLAAVRTRAFGWVAVAAFLAAGVFWASVTYARTTNSLKVRPAAVIADGNTTTGFFIAETDSQIYLGRNRIVRAEEAPAEEARIVVLPKDEVNDLVIGPLMSQESAYTRLGFLEEELCQAVNQRPLVAIEDTERAKRTECERALLRTARR
jgi:hypothetical protein